jgi:hypothetical protein
MIGVVATLLVLLATGAAPAADPSLSPAKAQAMVDKLALLEKQATLRKPPPGSPVRVSESEVNSYLNLTRAGQMPKGVSDVKLDFEHDRLVARGLVDLEQFRKRVPHPEGLENLLGFLSGTVPVEVAGRIRPVSEGVCAFVIEGAHIATVPVPVPVIERLGLWATTSASHPQGIDVKSPVRLPHGVKRVRLEPGYALLY